VHSILVLSFDESDTKSFKDYGLEKRRSPSSISILRNWYHKSPGVPFFLGYRGSYRVEYQY
jgi:AAA+ ATPase superfamily predicted ATPase